MSRSKFSVRALFGALILITILGVLLILLIFGQGGGEVLGVDRDEAINIAQQRVAAEGVMSLEGREPVVEDGGDTWHIYFILSDPEVLGGEPHVFVSKQDGSVTEIYYTQ